jgi:hypothetical protein
MTTHFTEQEWLDARHEMTRILIGRARQGRPIAYSELVQHVTSISFDHYDPLLNKMLGEISKSENEQERGMLTVLVVYKDGEMKPGPGFFELATRLGRNASDDLACWVTEYEYVTRYWQQRRQS